MCIALLNFLKMKFPDAPRKRVSWLADGLSVSYSTAYRYVKGARKPEDSQIVAIYVLTDGVVQPNDFYDLPDLDPPPRGFREFPRGGASAAGQSTVARNGQPSSVAALPGQMSIFDCIPPLKKEVAA